MSHKTVLSFHDALLRESDVQLLRGPYWLNDQVIEFWFEYLAKKAYRAVAGDVLLVPAATTFLLANSPVDVGSQVLQMLGAESASAIGFAVNDNDDVTAAEAGSHWSLLVFCAGDRSFAHFDSMAGSNAQHASMLAARVAAALWGEGGARGVTCTAAKWQQQGNGYDCGVFACAAAEALCAAVDGPKKARSATELADAMARWWGSREAGTDYRARIRDVVDQEIAMSE